MTSLLPPRTPGPTPAGEGEALPGGGPPGRGPGPAARERRRVRWGIQLLLTAGVTWVIVRQVGVTLDEALALDRALPAPSPGWLGLASLLLLGGFVLSAWLWGRMVGEIGGRDPGPGASVRIVFTANLGRYLPGKVWQMAGLALLSRRIGISATVGATAGVLGQLFALAAAGVLAAPVLVDAEGGRSGAILAAVGALAVLVGAASVPGVLRGALRLLFRAARLPPERLPRTGAAFGPRWVAWHAVAWGVYGAAFVAFVRGLGFGGGFLELAPAFAGAYLLGYLAVFAPAGIGVREGFLIAFLRPELGGAAVGIAVLARVWMTLVEVLPAGLVALREVFRTRASGGAGRET